jgi:hypothetical protein
MSLKNFLYSLYSSWFEKVHWILLDVCHKNLVETEALASDCVMIRVFVCELAVDAMQVIWRAWNRSTPLPHDNLAGWSSSQ